MKTYQYKRPKGDKYTIGAGKWNTVFNKRSIKPLIHKVEVYVTNDQAVCQFVLSVFGKVVLILSLPVLYLIGTLQVGVKETHEDIKHLLFQKHYGAFSSDVIFKSSQGNGWDKLNRLLIKQTLNLP